MSRPNGSIKLVTKTRSADFIKVTPEMATDWLENHNNVNRPKRFSLEDKYTRDRVDGNYIIGWHAIAFDWNGEMLNGQHTCKAIIESGISEEHLVVKGLDPRSRMTGDTDAPRRPHDILKLLGYEATPWDVAIVRQMMNGLRSRATMTEIVHAYSKHEPAVRTVMGMFPHKVRKITISTVLAPMVRAFYTEDETKLQKFADILFDGLASRSRKGDLAVILLRDYLLQLQTFGGDGGAREVYGRTETALHAFINNIKLTELVRTTEELFPLEDDENIKSE
jgi:hypothetical protein